ncbi:MAG: transporter substrate-binding domain-containing protein [Nocardioides sp.]
MTPIDDAVTADLAPTGVLRAVINLGNPVLAAGAPDAPTGVTADLARELARRLDLPLSLLCVDAARKSCDAVTAGEADVCFVAIEPARASDLAFTAAYVVLEGVYVVRDDSPVCAPADVDRAATRVGVKRGSAYDLFLTRSLEAADIVRGEEGVDVFAADGLEVGAGIRLPATDWVAAHPGHRVVEPAFTEIQQALATSVSRAPETVRLLHAFVEDIKASGVVADALRRAGRRDAVVAPPA